MVPVLPLSHPGQDVLLLPLSLSLSHRRAPAPPHHPLVQSFIYGALLPASQTSLHVLLCSAASAPALPRSVLKKLLDTGTELAPFLFLSISSYLSCVDALSLSLGGSVLKRRGYGLDLLLPTPVLAMFSTGMLPSVAFVPALHRSVSKKLPDPVIELDSFLFLSLFPHVSFLMCYCDICLIIYLSNS
jgi:hypothetical protein